MAPTTTGTVLTSGTVSYTAPQFTEEDLKRERESLSVEEREEIDAEVRGTRAILRETPKLIERGLIGMQRTLNEIPDHEKEGYLKALERCPDLVRTETDSLIFLRAERFDPIAAARRLVKNWDVRCKLFGDRSFLPMDLSGGDTGALTDDDLDALQRGVCLCAPEDSMGRVALILNRGRIHQDEAIVSKNLGPFNARCFFYLAHVVAQDEMAQKHGFVFIVNSKDAHYANFNRKRVKLALDISWSALPIRLNTIILTFPAIKSEAKLFLPVILWLMSRGLRQRALVFSGCPNELCFDLEEIRLRKRCIPDVLGGQFCLEDFQQWIRKRREHEVASSSSLGPTRMLLEDMDDVSE